MKKYRLLLPLAIGAITTSSIAPMVCCNKTTHLIDFATCSWDELNTWCEKLEKGEITDADFCSHFKIGKKAVASMNDFVGVVRTIKINDIDHQLRVIGYNHDTIAAGELKGAKAALTFELKTLLSQTNGYTYPLTAEKSTGVNYDYLKSDIKANLTGKPNKASWGSTPELEDHRTAWQMLPSDVTSAIKTVNKYVAISDDQGGNFEVKEYSDKLFVLTATEMAQENTELSDWLKEGKPYAFWIENEKKESHERFNGRLKWDSLHTTFPYWLSTPLVTTTREQRCEIYRCRIGDFGEFGYGTVTNTNGTSFAFCI